MLSARCLTIPRRKKVEDARRHLSRVVPLEFLPLFRMTEYECDKAVPRYLVDSAIMVLRPPPEADAGWFCFPG